MRLRGGHARWTPDALGLAWTVLAAVAVMAPVLRPGVSLGSFDLLSRIGLTRHGGVAVHSYFPADQVLYFLPLTNAAWHQVHAGHLPLWNPANVLGMPLAFSWQSGVFSLPVLLSYLAPVKYAYTVIVLAKLVIAGTGAYTLCRVLGMGPVAAAFGGTVFELSGPMLQYSGWAMTGVTCWSGWIFAAAILLVRGRHRLRWAVALALAVAAAVYGGHPESLAVLGISLVIFLAVSLGVRARRDGGALRRPVVDLALAGACGMALGAPLILPGLQVVQASGRAAATGGAAYPLSHLSDLVVGLQGTDLRVPPPYVGVIAVALAVVAVRVLWRRPDVLGLAAVVGVGALLTYKSPIHSVVQALPVLGRVTWNRDIMLVALALAVLGAAGLDQVVRGSAPAVVRRWALWSLGGAALVVGLVSVAVAAGAQHTGGGERARLAWAAGEVALSVAVILVWRRGRVADLDAGTPEPAATADALSGRPAPAVQAHRGTAGALLVAQSAFMVALGVSFWSISAGYFSPTPAITALRHQVGSSLVATGPCRPLPFTPPVSTEPGIRPNANIAYGVREFAVYEPVLPTAYFSSWTAVSGQTMKSSLRRVGLFCPEITTATEARLYGVQYVLTPAHAKRPTGMVRAGTVGGEPLYRVPGAAEATLSAFPAPGHALATDAPGRPVAVTRPDPASVRIVTDAAVPEVLRLRLTALPGWHATVDGQPLALASWASGAMLEARLAAGHHVVELHYWPGLFSAGLAVAAAVVVGWAACVVVISRRSRRARR